MEMTREEKVALIKKKRRASAIPLKERKANKRKKQSDYVKMKQGHNWHSVWTTHYGTNGGMAGSMSPQFCKTCGMNYQMFKFKPESCEEFLAKRMKNNTVDNTANNTASE